MAAPTTRSQAPAWKRTARGTRFAARLCLASPVDTRYPRSARVSDPAQTPTAGLLPQEPRYAPPLPAAHQRGHSDSADANGVTWDNLLAQSVTLKGERYFLGRMRNTGVHHFGCLYHDVETINNRAERAIRPAVIARKVSCGNRTQRGASTWQILVSLATTAQQCGREFLEELTTAIPLIQLLPAG